MGDFLKRRDFIKNLSLAGASIAIANPVSPKGYLNGVDDNSIKNDHFTVSFDKKKGTINIYRNSGAPFLIDGKLCANNEQNKLFLLADRL
jgi:hypothetical protein